MNCAQNLPLGLVGQVLALRAAPPELGGIIATLPGCGLLKKESSSPLWVAVAEGGGGEALRLPVDEPELRPGLHRPVDGGGGPMTALPDEGGGRPIGVRADFCWLAGGIRIIPSAASVSGENKGVAASDWRPAAPGVAPLELRAMKSTGSALSPDVGLALELRCSAYRDDILLIRCVLPGDVPRWAAAGINVGPSP